MIVFEEKSSTNGYRTSSKVFDIPWYHVLRVQTITVGFKLHIYLYVKIFFACCLIVYISLLYGRCDERNIKYICSKLYEIINANDWDVRLLTS